MSLQALETEVAALRQQLAAAQAESRMWRDNYKTLARTAFGRRSERLANEHPAQLIMMAPAEPEAKQEEAKPSPKRGQKRSGRRAGGGGGRRALPAHIERTEVTSSDEGTTVCPSCAGELQVIGTETSERLEYVPGHYKALVSVCTKRACKTCPSQGVFTQPPPPFAVAKSQFADGFIAKVLVDKYADNIPMRRQVTRFAREGLPVAIASLCRVVLQSADLLIHVVNAMADDLRAGTFLQGDATGFPILVGPQNDRISGALWVYTDGEQAVFQASTNHRGEHATAFLQGFSGVFLPDGAATYNAACAPESIERGGCWAHVRRKFFDARDGHPAAFEALSRIRELFANEREAWTVDAESRQRIRTERQQPWLNDFKKWVYAQLMTAEPRSTLHKALQYTLRQWPNLVTFIDHPDVPIHNNTSERALRGPVTGRKNWLFAGSEAGAHAAAVHFSIMQSCMMVGIDPFAYLRDVLHRLPDAKPSVVSQLTPKAWAARMSENMPTT